jgi:hypothetical protein
LNITSTVLLTAATGPLARHCACITAFLQNNSKNNISLHFTEEEAEAQKVCYLSKVMPLANIREES